MIFCTEPDKKQEILNYTPPEGKCIIYRYSSDVGDYIGQTKYSMKKRAGKDGAGYLNNKYQGTKWAQAIQTYSIDYFTPEILEECLESEADDKEKFYIQKYNSWQAGFNSTPGGKYWKGGAGDIRYTVINLPEIYTNLSEKAQNDLLFIYTHLLDEEPEPQKELVTQLCELSQRLEHVYAWYSYYAFEGECEDYCNNVLLWLLNFDFLEQTDFSAYIETYNKQLEFGRKPSMWGILSECFSYREVLGGDIVTAYGDTHRYKFVFE